MKKRYVLFAALLMTLASCNKGNSTSNSTGGNSTSTPGSVSTSTSTGGVVSQPSLPPVENTIYFNLGRYGLFDGKAGTSIDSVSLEYGVSYTALTGTDLPGADRVTNSRGQKFLYWVMPSSTGGALTRVDKMPANPGTILEAWWEEGKIDPDDPVIPNPPDKDYQYLSSTADGSKDYVLSVNFSAMFNVDEYSITADFTAGYEFKFHSTNNLYSYDATSYPTLLSGKGDNGYSLCADTNAGNYTKNYIEVTGTPIESGVNDAGEDWYKFNTEAPNLRFKESGNYTLYIRIYDNGGWLQIYAVKNA